MTKIITVTNSKGGVGKTTTSIYLATILSKYGSVLLKDADPQGSTTDWVEEIEEVQKAPFDFEITNQRNIGKTKGYDFVVIDTPPQHADIIESAIAVADFVVIPTSTSNMDLSKALSIVSKVSKDNVYKVLLTQTDARTSSYKFVNSYLAEENIKCFEQFIPKRESIKNSVGTIPGKQEQLKEYVIIAEEIREYLSNEN